MNAKPAMAAVLFSLFLGWFPAGPGTCGPQTDPSEAGWTCAPKSFHFNKTLNFEDCTDKDGRLKLRRHYSTDGKLIEEDFYNDVGLFLLQRFYYSNGQLRTEYGEERCYYKQYDREGALLEEMTKEGIVKTHYGRDKKLGPGWSEVPYRKGAKFLPSLDISFQEWSAEEEKFNKRYGTLVINSEKEWEELVSKINEDFAGQYQPSQKPLKDLITAFSKTYVAGVF